MKEVVMAMVVVCSLASGASVAAVIDRASTFHSSCIDGLLALTAVVLFVAAFLFSHLAGVSETDRENNQNSPRILKMPEKK
jgi:xanthine/uracil/vitamin C permease (AzgA family)